MNSPRSESPGHGQLQEVREYGVEFLSGHGKGGANPYSVEETITEGPNPLLNRGTHSFTPTTHRNPASLRILELHKFLVGRDLHKSHRSSHSGSVILTEAIKKKKKKGRQVQPGGPSSVPTRPGVPRMHNWLPRFQQCSAQHSRCAWGRLQAAFNLFHNSISV